MPTCFVLCGLTPTNAPRLIALCAAVHVCWHPPLHNSNTRCLLYARLDQCSVVVHACMDTRTNHMHTSQVAAIFVVSFFAFLGLFWLFEPEPQIIGYTLRRHSAGTTSFSLPCCCPHLRVLGCSILLQTLIEHMGTTCLLHL